MCFLEPTSPARAWQLRWRDEQHGKTTMIASNRMLADRYGTKGTAFAAEERDCYGLHGLIPPVVEDLGTQLKLVELEHEERSGDPDRHIYLRALQQRNSVLFFAFVESCIKDVLLIVYTLTVGLACQQWSRLYRREHGLYLSWSDRHCVADLLDNAEGDHDIDVVVATDGERILGLGGLGGLGVGGMGVGGMGIPMPQRALHTAGGGMEPSRTLPVMLDVGTDNEGLVSDPLYLGWRHRRMRGDEYDELVDAFVNAHDQQFPDVLLQWEDFAQSNANR
jgi:malate dehydrogenase (oxaloacetate-decarboxylating)